MRPLILLLRIFTVTFGTTRPKPEEERKYALFVGALLLLIVAAVIATVLLVLFTLRH